MLQSTWHKFKPSLICEIIGWYLSQKCRCLDTFIAFLWSYYITLYHLWHCIDTPFGLWQYTDIFLFPIATVLMVYEIIWTIVVGTIFECSLWSLKFGHCFRQLRLLNTPMACAIYLDTLFIYKNTWHMLSLVLSDKSVRYGVWQYFWIPVLYDFI